MNGKIKGNTGNKPFLLSFFAGIFNLLSPSAYSQTPGNLTCNICGRSSKKFLEFGSPKRKNAKCPKCSSLERHRLFFFALERVLGNRQMREQKYRVLHFAPEKCLSKFLGRLFYDIDYITADIHKGRAMEVVDIQNIKFTDNSFDLIFCNHVLEHIVDDNKAMLELHRVLKKSGKAFLTVPIDAGLKTTYEDFSIMSPSMRRVHFGQEDL